MFKFIERIFSIALFRKALTSRVVSAFTDSFNDTNVAFEYSSKVNPATITYIKNREIILSKKTMDRLHGNLEFAILEGIKAKESINDIKKRIVPLFDNMKDYEIERLARTEIINAQQEGVYQSHVAAGVATHKMWKAHHDKRTGGDSKRLDGQIVAIDEEFIDYETNKTCMHPPMRPNDRCTCIYLYKLPKTTRHHGLTYKA